MDKPLSAEELDLLKVSLERKAPKLLEKVDLLDKGLIDVDTVNDMRGAVGSELAGWGFDKDGDINEYGMRLEDLIDRLADLYIWPDKNRDSNDTVMNYLREPITIMSVAATLLIIVFLLVAGDVGSIWLRIFIISICIIGVFVALFLVARERKRGKPYPRPSILSTLGSLFVVIGLFFPDYPLICFSFIGTGIILVLIDVVMKKRRRS